MTRSIHQPHDSLFKVFLSDIKIAKDFLAIHLPEAIKEHCDFSTLRLEHGSFVEEDLRKHFSDILYSLMIKGRLGYIYPLLEHVTTPRELIPFTMLRYTVAVMKDHLCKGNKALPIVVPLVFYRGQVTPYPYSNDIMDCFENKALAREIFLKPYKVVDITVIPDEEIRAHKSVALMELLQKHIQVRDMMDLVHDIVAQIREDILTPEQIRSVLYYVVNEGETVDYKKFFTEIARGANEALRGDIMTIAQQMKQDFMATLGPRLIEQGMEKGMEKGEKKKALIIARNMRAKGLDNVLIKEMTDLSDEDLASL